MKHVLGYVLTALLAGAIGLAAGAVRGYGLGFHSAQLLQSLEARSLVDALGALDAGTLERCRQNLDSQLDLHLFLHGVGEADFVSWDSQVLYRVHAGVSVPPESLDEHILPAIEYRRSHPSPVTNPRFRGVVDRVVGPGR